MNGRRAVLLIIPIVVLSIAGIAAAAFTPILVRDAPLLLIALEARNRFLLLVSGKLGTAEFVIVGVLRRFASDPFFYLLGRWYGDSGREWASRRFSGGRRAVAATESLFRRVEAAAVALFPGALVCVLAGETGMSPRRFAALNLCGSLVTVGALRLFADAARSPLETVVAFNDRNAVWLTVLFVVATAGWLAASRGRPRSGEGREDLPRPKGPTRRPEDRAE